MQWASVSRIRVQGFDIIFTHLNISVYIALFILKFHLSSIFLAGFRNARLNRKVDHPDDLPTGAQDE